MFDSFQISRGSESIAAPHSDDDNLPGGESNPNAAAISESPAGTSTQGTGTKDASPAAANSAAPNNAATTAIGNQSGATSPQPLPLTLGISSVVLGLVAIGAVVYAIDKKRFASRRQDDVVRMKMERDRLQQENYDLKARVSLQPVNTVSGRLAAVQDGYSSDRNFQALHTRLEQLATSINGLHQQLEAVQERLTPQRDTTVDQFLDGIRQGLVNSEPQHSAHGFLNQVERLCDRWLSDPAIAEKLSTLLRAYRDRAATARARLNAPARPLQTLSMREMGETVVGLLQTSGAPQQAGNGTDWEWLAVDWRDYVYRLGHELDQLVDEERLSDGAKVAAEAELALLCQQLEIASIVATPGSRVDYNQHEVVARVRANTVIPNTIMRTKRRGYIHASKLVQKAEVVVGVD